MITRLECEIHEQPDCLARLLVQGRSAVEEIAAAVRRFAPAFIVTAARGSSDNAARYAKYLFGGHNRLVVSLGAPSLVTRYATPPSLERALVVGISQSGESHDIVALLAEGRRQGALTVAITNRPGSPLSRAAEYELDLGAGPEESVVASKSYTGQLMALAMLSTALADDAAHWRDLETVPQAARETLAMYASERSDRLDRGAAAVAALAAAARMVIVGRGFNFATAFEIALKIKETAYVMADPYATPDLFHGPLAMVEPGFPAIVIGTGGPTRDDVTVALDALESRGAHVLAISNDTSILGRVPVGSRLPFAAQVPEWLSPLVAVIPGQLCALRLAEARGLDADRPRGLAKVTRTR
jgi:glucosamine--fructose-6-phosphate aminotransferase (isomerizing)